MNTEITPVVNKGTDLELTAAIPTQMAQANEALVHWCGDKIQSIQADIAELAEEVAIATRNKWRTSALKKQLALAEKRVVYFGKIAEALRLGYHLVPNFPITVFAIRTSQETPTGRKNDSRWATFEQEPQLMEPGQGEYRNPFPVIYQETIQNYPKEGQSSNLYYPEDWKAMEFPVAMAKPQIMKSTEEAMAAGIFDQLGVVPPARRKDPMIIAQIMDPTPPSRYSRTERKRVSFLVAWFLDTKVL